MFIDASAVLGILLKEDDHELLTHRLESSRTPLTTSPVAVLEMVINLARLAQITIPQAQEFIGDFLKTLNVRNVPITPEIGSKAIRAYAQYGKGQGTKAQLNMGDCLAYACAKNYDLPLLYKGHDFTHTDLA